MSRYQLLEMQARERAGQGADWSIYHASCLPEGKTTQTYRLRGGVKSGRKWTSQQEVYITPADHDEWVGAWQTRTGLCPECMGTGEVFASWSKRDGTKMRPCGKCPNAAATATSTTKAPEPSRPKR